MKKVLLFHQGADLYGSDKIFLLVANALSRTHRLKVVLDSNGPLVDKLKNEGVSDISIMDLGVLRRKKISGALGIFSFFWEFLKAIKASRKLVKEFYPDIVYVNTLAVLAPLFSCLFNRAKVFHHIHEIQFRPKAFVRVLYSLSCILSDQVICVSGSVKKCVEQMSFVHSSKCKILYNGIPSVNVSEQEKLKLRKEIGSEFRDFSLPLLAFVARIHSWKGQLEFLEVVKILRDRFNVHVNVAFFGDVFPGYEDILRNIDQRIETYGLSENVRCFGFRKDAPVLFAISDLSIMGSTEPDPLPTIVLESMQQETPVIAYAHGGSCEMLKDGVTGVLVSPISADEMAGRIAQIVYRPSVIREMGRNAKIDFDNRFSHQSFIERLSREFSVHG